MPRSSQVPQASLGQRNRDPYSHFHRSHIYSHLPPRQGTLTDIHTLARRQGLESFEAGYCSHLQFHFNEQPKPSYGRTAMATQRPLRTLPLITMRLDNYHWSTDNSWKLIHWSFIPMINGKTYAGIAWMTICTRRLYRLVSSKYNGIHRYKTMFFEVEILNKDVTVRRDVRRILPR